MDNMVCEKNASNMLMMHSYASVNMCEEDEGDSKCCIL